MTTRIQFSEEMARLDHDILTMGSKVAEDLRKALLALRNGDTGLAKEVKADDELINALQLKIQDQAAVLIATQQPVAHDLRTLVAVFKVTDNLERAGDYAVHLGKTAIKLSKQPQFRQAAHLEKMAEIGAQMVQQAVESYLNHDAAAARNAAALDDGIDHEHKALVQDVLEFIKHQPEQADLSYKLIKTSGYLERLGDHMTNLCEAVVYMEEGRHVELNE